MNLKSTKIPPRTGVAAVTANIAGLLHLSLALLPDRLGALALSDTLAAGFVGVPDAAPLEKVPKRLSLTQTL